MSQNFAIVGVGGFIAPRHLKAIKETQNTLVAAIDPSDSVGILDSYFPDAAFFTEFERFDRHIDKLRRLGNSQGVDYISICSPNYLHDAHIRFALRNGAHAICEKPIVLNSRNIRALKDLEKESGKRVFTILQLRVHPAIMELKKKMDSASKGVKYKVELRYVTPRGKWYHYSWKGMMEKSGGLATNIGIHLFDLLIWMFGDFQSFDIAQHDSEKIIGTLVLERAEVSWLLSIDRADLEPGKERNRLISIDGESIDFTKGFEDLHTRVYEETLAGRGFGIEEALPAIKLVEKIRERIV